MAKVRTNRRLEGVNAIPEEVINEGFATRLNPEPVYYTPDGAGPLVCAILDRQQGVNREDGTESFYYNAVCLANFKNGKLDSGEQQPHAVRGDVIRIGEKAQFQQLARYAGRAITLYIAPGEKIALKGGKTCWTFAIYGKPLDGEDRRMVLGAGLGGVDAPLLTE